MSRVNVHHSHVRAVLGFVLVWALTLATSLAAIPRTDDAFGHASGQGPVAVSALVSGLVGDVALARRALEPTAPQLGKAQPRPSIEGFFQNLRFDAFDAFLPADASPSVAFAAPVELARVVSGVVHAQAIAGEQPRSRGPPRAA